jgi:hypothetical protein
VVGDGLFRIDRESRQIRVCSLHGAL